MEINLYSNKQILGGFVLLIMIVLLFGVNIMVMNNNNSGVNLSYFVTPLVFTMCLISILYILAQKKSIQQTLDKYILPDNFDIINCPYGYNKQKFGKNVQCVPINPNE